MPPSRKSGKVSPFNRRSSNSTKKIATPPQDGAMMA